MQTNLSAFARFLRSQRDAKRLSRREMATQIGMSESGVQLLEEGKSAPSSTTLLALSRLLGPWDMNRVYTHLGADQGQVRAQVTHRPALIHLIDVAGHLSNRDLTLLTATAEFMVELNPRGESKGRKVKKSSAPKNRRTPKLNTKSAQKPLVTT